MDSPSLDSPMSGPICVNGRPVEELDEVIKRRTRSQGSISGLPLRSPVVTRADSEKSVSLSGWVSLCENGDNEGKFFSRVNILAKSSNFVPLLEPKYANFFPIWGLPRGKRDRVIRHILEREDGNWMEKNCVIS